MVWGRGGGRTHFPAVFVCMNASVSANLGGKEGRRESERIIVQLISRADCVRGTEGPKGETVWDRGRNLMGNCSSP